VKEKFGMGLLIFVIVFTIGLRGVSNLFAAISMHTHQSQNEVLMDVKDLSYETPDSEMPALAYSPQPRSIYYLPNTIKNASASWGFPLQFIKLPLLVKNYWGTPTPIPSPTATPTPTSTPACSPFEHPDCYEPNQDFIQSSPLFIPVHVEANGNPLTDSRDYYVVSLIGGHTYRFELKFAGINNNPTDASLRQYIFDGPSTSNLRCFSSELGGRTDSIFRYTPYVTGDYWILVLTDSNSGSKTVRYQMDISLGTADKTCATPTPTPSSVEIYP